MRGLCTCEFTIRLALRIQDTVIMDVFFHIQNESDITQITDIKENIDETHYDDFLCSFENFYCYPICSSTLCTCTTSCADCA